MTKLERVGARLGLSESMLGMVAALAADAPEITASVTALAGHQARIGAGVTLGSNVFNLAALLGLAAIVSGGIALHRRVIAMEAAVAVPIAAHGTTQSRGSAFEQRSESAQIGLVCPAHRNRHHRRGDRGEP